MKPNIHYRFWAHKIIVEAQHLTHFGKTPRDKEMLECEIASILQSRDAFETAAKILLEGAESEGWDRYRGTDETRTGIAELRSAFGYYSPTVSQDDIKAAEQSREAEGRHGTYTG